MITFLRRTSLWLLFCLLAVLEPVLSIQGDPKVDAQPLGVITQKGAVARPFEPTSSGSSLRSVPVGLS